MNISSRIGVAALVCLLTVPVSAEMCTLDPVPAATLLLPYFEVDLDPSNRVTTMVSIHNARPEASLAHVTLWTDYSLPSVDFDLFFTGYDVVRINLGDVFRQGFIPITADHQSDPGDTISPHGANPQFDGSFDDCDRFFPFYSNPVITGVLLERIRDGHTGNDVDGNGCLGFSHGDNIARGYMTVDMARRCSIEYPSDEGYFGGLDPVASDENALWGEYKIFDFDNDSMISESLVHIEADPSFDATSTPTGYTFYGRYTQDTAGDDHREPLGNVWGARYLDPITFSGRTDYIVWRDSTSSVTPSWIACDSNPDWYPLQETAVTCWDEEESVTSLCDPQETDPACFPLETQRVSVGSGDLTPPWDFGWCSIDFDVPGDSFSGDVDFPSSGGNTTQAYMAAVSQSSGRYEIGFTALQLEHVCDVQLETADAGEARQ